MKNEISVKEARELITTLVQLRKNCAFDKKSKREFLKMQEVCVKKFDYLVINRARRYSGFSNYEDLYQDGRLALVAALKTYDLDKGDFFWWANKYIKTKMSREANKHSTIKIPLKHAKEMTPYKVSKIPTMIDESSSAMETMENQEQDSIVRNAIGKLPEDQRRVIELHFEIGSKAKLSIGKICKQLNMPRIKCEQLLNDAKDVLRQELAGITYDTI